jgi:RNA polymerase sigma factor (sigma-70 family)
MVRKAQAGDAQSREELFRLAMPYIERVSHTRPLRTGESVSDRRQNVCQRIHEKLDQFRGAQEAPDDEQTWALFCGWVRQIVFTVTAKPPPDREAKAHVPLSPGDSTGQGGIDPAAVQSTPTARVRRSEEAERVLAALGKLADPVNREIVRLRFFDGLSLREITSRVGLTYDMVRERFSLCMRRLRKELEDLE